MNSPFKEIRTQTAPTAVFEIFIAGDINNAKRFLAKLAGAQGACWSVDPTEFIYSGGRELGFVVRIINYPRFPKSTDVLEQSALDLAKELMIELGQGSCSVVGPNTTTWIDRRK